MHGTTCQHQFAPSHRKRYSLLVTAVVYYIINIAILHSYNDNKFFHRPTSFDACKQRVSKHNSGFF